MAIYHFSGQVMSRISKQTGKPKSPLAAAAYRSGDKLVDDVDNQSFYYKREVKPDTHILVPSNAPEWASDRERLWNEVNKIEKNYNAQFAREFNVALPVELTNEQQKQLTLDFCKEAFVDKGMVADIAIHRDDKNNPHFHVMLTVRPFNEDGSWGIKAKREYKFDENGNHILDKNGKKKFDKVTTTDWNKKETFNEWRKLWADKANHHLKENGITETISHLSNEDRGIETMPTIHEGYVSRKMESEGKRSDRVSINKEINTYNEKIKELNAYKDQKKKQIREQRFYRKFSPSEKKQLADIAKELKLFVNEKTVRERTDQLKEWKKSILFTPNSDSKLRQLERIKKEEELLFTANEILSAESERFIQSYYPNWDMNALSFDEKIMLVNETISAKRTLSDDEIDLLDEKVLNEKVTSAMNQLYSNPYQFAISIDKRIDSILVEKNRLEGILNINSKSTEIEIKTAAMKHPKELKSFKKILKEMNRVIAAKDLINDLYNTQINRLYPGLDNNKLSFQEKDLLINAAEYYGEPIKLDTINSLQRYSVSEQIEILDLMEKGNFVEVESRFNLEVEKPRHLIFFKDECMRNLHQYPTEKNYLELVKRIDPLPLIMKAADYKDVSEMNDTMNGQIESGSSYSILSSVTNGMLQGLLQDRSYSSKKQFEEDLKAKSKKMKNNQRSGPSL